MRLQKIGATTCVLALFVSVAGCKSDSSPMRISPMFNVCIDNTEARYDLNKSKLVDWDDGELHVANAPPIHVYIGEHPDFKVRSPIPSQVTQESFVRLGAQTEDGVAKILYVEVSRKRPVYVMFASSDIRQEVLIERVKNFNIAYCRGAEK